MSVLHVIGYMRPGGGPGGYLYNIHKELGMADSDEIGVYSRNVSNERTSPILSSVYKFIATAIYRIIKSLFYKEYFTLDEHEKMNKYSSIVFHDMYMAIAARRDKAITSKIGLMIHSPKDPKLEMSDQFPHFKSIVRFLIGIAEKLSINSADFLVLPNEGAIDGYSNDLKRLIRNKEIVEVASGVEALISTNDSLFNKNEVNICFLGRYNFDKGYDRYLKIASLHNSKEGFRFHSAGIGSIKTNKYVNDLGWRSDIANIIASSDFIIVPNRVSYYDLIILEALSLGTKVITSAIGGSIGHGDTKGVYLIKNDSDFENNVANLVNSLGITSVDDRVEITDDFMGNHSVKSMINEYECKFKL